MNCFYLPVIFSVNFRCWAVGFFLEKMPLKWVINHQLTFLMALMFVIHDLSNEVCIVIYNMSNISVL